jgi:hypothetical protein
VFSQNIHRMLLALPNCGRRSHNYRMSSSISQRAETPGSILCAAGFCGDNTSDLLSQNGATIPGSPPHYVPVDPEICVDKNILVSSTCVSPSWSVRPILFLYYARLLGGTGRPKRPFNRSHGNEEFVRVILKLCKFMVKIKGFGAWSRASTTTPTDATSGVFLQLL